MLEGKVDGGFESLSYGEMQERTAALDKQREATAYLLITICVRANRAKVSLASAPQRGSAVGAGGLAGAGGSRAWRARSRGVA